VDGPAGLLDGAADRVEFDVSNAKDGGGFFLRARGGLSPAHGSADARGELAELEGLGNVIVGAGVERFDFIVLAVSHGEHEDGDARKEAAYVLAGVDAVHAWHIDVEQDSVEGIGADEGKSLFAARGLYDLEAELLQGSVQRTPD
jgi:hypothetical protein